MKWLLLGGASLLSVMAPVQGQLRVTDFSQNGVPTQLAEKLLGGGVTVFNVQYTGLTNAAGFFCDGEDALGLENGILLTSGRATNVLGPNNESAAGTDNGLPGDADLDGLIPGFETEDANVLEFDFVAEGDEVQFQYVFGSEEYNEYVDSPFNDVFGFFVNGVNYALLPGTVTPVAINNVNNGNAAALQVSTGPCVNCAFYVDNVAGARNIQLDGLTTVLTFTAPVLPGSTNRLKIAVADAGDGILDSAVFLLAGSLRSGINSNCVTRDARYWFTHYDGTNGCVTLREAMRAAIRAGCDGVDLGFINLPLGYHNDDNVRDFEDAAIEALGLYWRSVRLTGEIAGTQASRRLASRLCQERKRLAVEYLSAQANIALFNLDPARCSYKVSGVWTNFPADLVNQARDALAGFDVDQVRAYTVLLKKFNASGRLNDFPAGLAECSETRPRDLRALSRDPTTELSCPGINESCETAEAIVFPASQTNIFATASVTRSVSLTKYQNDTSGLICGTTGRDAVWKILPAVGVAGRRFTVDTTGSNFDTVISVVRGDCSELVSVACNQDLANGVLGERVSFTTDGTSIYRIILSGRSGAVGSARLRVTSP